MQHCIIQGIYLHSVQKLFCFAFRFVSNYFFLLNSPLSSGQPLNHSILHIYFDQSTMNVYRQDVVYYWFEIVSKQLINFWLPDSRALNCFRQLWWDLRSSNWNKSFELGRASLLFHISTMVLFQTIFAVLDQVFKAVNFK